MNKYLREEEDGWDMNTVVEILKELLPDILDGVNFKIELDKYDLAEIMAGHKQRSKSYLSLLGEDYVPEDCVDYSYLYGEESTVLQYVEENLADAEMKKIKEYVEKNLPADAAQIGEALDDISDFAEFLQSKEAANLKGDYIGFFTQMVVSSFESSWWEGAQKRIASALNMDIKELYEFQSSKNPFVIEIPYIDLYERDEYIAERIIDYIQDNLDSEIPEETDEKDLRDVVKKLLDDKKFNVWELIHNAVDYDYRESVPYEEAIEDLKQPIDERYDGDWPDMKKDFADLVPEYVDYIDGF